MSNYAELEKIFDFLNLELTEEGYAFFVNIKRSFSGNLTVFEAFIRSYLIIQKNGELPEDLHFDFVNYFHEMLELQGEESLLEQFAKYAKYYLMLHFEYIESSEIKEVISEINRNDLKIAYPFLMELMDDLENSRIDENAFVSLALNILEMAENADEAEFARFGLMVNQMLYNSPQESRAS